MNLMQVDVICGQAQQAKRQGHVAEAMRILEDGITACERNKSEEICFAPLLKSLAKLHYIQRDFSRAQDLYCRAIDIYKLCGVEDQVGTCVMHLGACSEEFVKSKFFPTYLWSLETGSYAGAPQEAIIGIGELGMKLGAVLYDRYTRRKGEASVLQSITTVEQLDGLINLGGGLIDISSLSPEMATVLDLYYRGTRSFQANCLEEAIEDYRSALKLAPRFIAARCNLGNALLSFGYPKRALHELRVAHRYSPNDPDIWLSLGNVYSELEDDASAMECYERAHKLRPTHIATVVTLSGMYIDSSRLGEAEELLQRGLDAISLNQRIATNLKIDPNNHEWDSELSMIHHQLGLINYKRGDWLRATVILEKCVELVPADTRAQSLLQKARERLR